MGGGGGAFAWAWGYPTKIKITDQQLAAVQIERDDFHPEWNYTIIPSVEKK